MKNSQKIAWISLGMIAAIGSSPVRGAGNSVGLLPLENFGPNGPAIKDNLDSSRAVVQYKQQPSGLVNLNSQENKKNYEQIEPNKKLNLNNATINKILKQNKGTGAVLVDPKVWPLDDQKKLVRHSLQRKFVNFQKVVLNKFPELDPNTVKTMYQAIQKDALKRLALIQKTDLKRFNTFKSIGAPKPKLAITEGKTTLKGKKAPLNDATKGTKNIQATKKKKAKLSDDEHFARYLAQRETENEGKSFDNTELDGMTFEEMKKIAKGKKTTSQNRPKTVFHDNDVQKAMRDISDDNYNPDDKADYDNINTDQIPQKKAPRKNAIDMQKKELNKYERNRDNNEAQRPAAEPARPNPAVQPNPVQDAAPKNVVNDPMKVDERFEGLIIALQVEGLKSTTQAGKIGEVKDYARKNGVPLSDDDCEKIITQVEKK